jgi:branched-chain amino acid transport system ATP-binding protein
MTIMSGSSTSEDIMLELTGVSAGYGATTVLRGVSLQSRPSAITAVLGLNGAGKSTLAKVMIGLLPLRSGTMRLGETDVTNKGSRVIARSGVAEVFEQRELFGELTVEENLMLGCAPHYRRSSREHRAQLRDREFDRFPRLRERARQQASTLSGGEQQMLAIGRALMSEPEILVLDEPSTGLAPLIIDQIFEVIADLARGGLSVVLMEQDARRALDVADHGYVLVTGEIVAEGSTADLRASPAFEDIYLGVA